MKSKILFVVALLVGLMMANSGLSKFIDYMPAIEMPEKANQIMGAFIESGWLFQLIGIAEIVGGILLIIPKTRAFGAAVLTPVVVGIILFNAVLAPGNLIISLVIGLILAWIIWENRHKYAPMFEK